MTRQVTRKSRHQNPIHSLVHLCIEHLFKAEMERLDIRLHELIKENSRLVTRSTAILFRGEILTPVKMIQLRAPGAVQKPDPSLLPDVESYVEWRDRVHKHKKKLSHGLIVASSRCRTLQDFRDMFPDALIMGLGSIQGKERTRPEGFLFHDNPSLQQQFHETVNLLLDYKANGLVYS